MKIAIIGSRGIPAQYGGFETFAEELSTRLVERGFEVTVFADSDSRGAGSEYKGVKISHTRSFSLGPLSTILHDLFCIIKALSGYDLIYVLGYGAGFFFWIPRIIGKPVWVNMDGLEWKRSKWPWYGRLYLRISEWFAVRFASLLISDAEAIRDYLMDRHGNGIACRTIPYGADIVHAPPDSKVISHHNLKQKEYYLIVCRLEPENHVREIAEGFALSDTEKKLVVIGDHSAVTPYVKDLLTLKDKRIRFMGTVYDSEMLKAVRYYSFAYFHGHSVGGTNPSLLEALGCGNVVIAHDNPFNREVASDCALFFSHSTQIPSLISSLESGIDTNLPTRAKDRILMKYSWDLITDQYEKLIKDTLR
jgi:glycosyltransferase involved in cell wall biosynthesis